MQGCVSGAQVIVDVLQLWNQRKGMEIGEIADLRAIEPYSRSAVWLMRQLSSLGSYTDMA